MSLGGIAGGIVVLALLSLLFVRRGGKGGGDIDWNYQEEDMMFAEQTASMYDSPAPLQASPRGPPPGHRGEMRDGYEVAEYPAGSDAWWWKDQSTGKWNEWT